MKIKAAPFFLLMPLLLALTAPSVSRNKSPLDNIAETYIKLALRLGQYKADYVDAYYGPAEWKPAPVHDTLQIFPGEELHKEALSLLDKLSGIADSSLGSSQKMRRHYLIKHVQALKTMIEIVHGKKMTFDEESEALYDAVSPHHDPLYYDSILQNLDGIIPGKGDISDRIIEFEKQFIIPHNKVDTLIKVAIAECRAQTKKHVSLPENENFMVECVGKKPWGAYNWFKGNAVSVIQVDTSRDWKIDAMLGLASHEGYPGHHVAGSLIESHLYRDSGWVEYSISLLFSPRSVLDEGEADFAIDLLFTPLQRVSFIKSTLIPLAGLDTANIDLYVKEIDLRKKMMDFAAETARAYLDGQITKGDATSRLHHYRGLTFDEAERAISFYDRYRAYIITYNVGEGLVKKYVERSGGKDTTLQDRWDRFTGIILNSMTPSDLADSVITK